MKTLLSIIASLFFFTSTPALATAPGYEWPDWIGEASWMYDRGSYDPYAGLAWSPLRYQPIGVSMNESTIRRMLRIQNQSQFTSLDRRSFTVPPAAFGGPALSLPDQHEWPEWIGRPGWVR